MASYEYECEECSQRFTIQESFREHDEHTEITCPACGSHEVRQLVDSIHIQTAKKS